VAWFTLAVLCKVLKLVPYTVQHAGPRMLARLPLRLVLTGKALQSPLKSISSH